MATTRKRGLAHLAEPLDLATSNTVVIKKSKSDRFLIEHLLDDNVDDIDSTRLSPVSVLPVAGSSPLLALVDCRLETRELWNEFFQLNCEMIITKSGRRMFPTVKVAISGCDPDALYYVLLDVVAVDNRRYRYVYNKSAWLSAGKAEPPPRTRLYMHPDSPFSGEQLVKQVVSFEKAKLTNNEVDKAGHLILNSMHKYQPRIHVLRRPRHSPFEQSTSIAMINDQLHNEHYKTFQFVETQFMAVTAYQNQLITKLKIKKNPFAKGFRDPSGRSPDYESGETSGTGAVQNLFLQQALLNHRSMCLDLLSKCQGPMYPFPFAFGALPPFSMHISSSSPMPIPPSPPDPGLIQDSTRSPSSQ